MTAPAPLDDRAPSSVDQSPTRDVQKNAPIIAAVDGSAASEAVIEAAVRLAGDLRTRIVFLYVRRGPAGFLGSPCTSAG
jgi:K+-sensing histidine kinase KdpD